MLARCAMLLGLVLMGVPSLAPDCRCVIGTPGGPPERGDRPPAGAPKVCGVRPPAIGGDDMACSGRVGMASPGTADAAAAHSCCALGRPVGALLLWLMPAS